MNEKEKSLDETIKEKLKIYIAHYKDDLFFPIFHNGHNYSYEPHFHISAKYDDKPLLSDMDIMSIAEYTMKIADMPMWCWGNEHIHFTRTDWNEMWLLCKTMENIIKKII